MKRKQRKQNISVVFNYSKIKLTEAMESLLNRGLNFAITPDKLSITDVLVQHQYFERRLLWIDFWSTRDSPEPDKKQSLFKENKTNMPKKYTPPEALKTFISATKSELKDPENQNKNVKPNLPREELLALKELINLQKKRILTIQKVDKGGGIILLDTPEYIRSCYEHLNKKYTNPDGSESHYYEQVDETLLETAKSEIKSVLKEAFDNDIITKQDFEAMDPSDKTPARYYQLFKMHKPHTPGSAPPERPVISGSGSITEKISHFVQHYIKDISMGHPSYIQDTPDFLRAIDSLEDVPDDAILVSIDVGALYTNLQREDAVAAVKDALEKREDKSMPTDFLVQI